MLWTGCRQIFMVSYRMSRCGSRRNSTLACLILKFGGTLLAFRSSGTRSNSMKYILYTHQCMVQAMYHSQFGEWVLATISPQIFLNSFLSAMWKRHINLPTKSITLNWCSSTMTCIPVLTIWRRHCCIFPYNTCTMLTLTRFLTYYPVLTHGEILAEPILCASSIVKKSHFSTTYHNKYIILEKLMSIECAEVSN